MSKPERPQAHSAADKQDDSLILQQLFTDYGRNEVTVWEIWSPHYDHQAARVLSEIVMDDMADRSNRP